MSTPQRRQRVLVLGQDGRCCPGSGCSHRSPLPRAVQRWGRDSSGGRVKRLPGTGADAAGERPMAWSCVVKDALIGSDGQSEEAANSVHMPGVPEARSQSCSRAGSVQRRRPSRSSQWGSHAIETAKFVEVCAAARLRRCCGGGPAPELRELVAGICLSVLSDAKQVEDLLAQEWVDSWQGWTELQANGSDSVAAAVAERFLRIAGANVPVRMTSNRERLRQLEEEGLDLKIASSHGVNNCLIDSLLLGLTLTGIVPQKYSVGERASVCAMCRENLLHEHGTPLGVYLDRHRDTPRILSFFFRELWAAEIAIRVYFHDCLDQAALGGAAAELAYVDFTRGAPPSDRQHTLYVYNHTDSTGKGYHFDALVRLPLRENDWSSASQETAAAVSAQESAARTEANSAGTDEPAQWAVRAEGAGQRLGSHGIAPEADKGATQKRARREEPARSTQHRPSSTGQKIQRRQPRQAARESGLARQNRRTKQLREAVQGEAQTESSACQTQQREDPLDAKAVSTWRPLKRLRTKTSVTASQNSAVSSELFDDDLYVLQLQAVEQSKDPRRAEELRIERLSEAISEQPTLPWNWQKMEAGVAYDLPNVHCSFKACEFQADNEEDLAVHIATAHDAAFASSMEATLTEAEKLRAYQGAVTWRCQHGAPVANVSIDRRALRLYRQSLEGDNVSSLLCFVCARKYPHAKTGRNQPIRWMRPLDSEGTSVFGLSILEAEKVLGIETYVKFYVAGGTVFAQAEMKKELQDWSCVVNLQGKLLTLLCCPEDKTCQKRCKADEMCTKCRVPVCNGCRRALLWEGKQPAAALSNDMMVYYAPQDIFEREVTVMEMLCASPCLTTMVCFSLEQKLRGDRALDQDQWMNRNRLVARGNATTFPLAWEDLLQQMQTLESGNKGREREKNAGGLPHCGEALRQMASVIVKSAHAKSDDVDIGRVIHQARVRRQVVVQLIEAAVERGHPAFQHVEMEAMYCKAAQLPEDAVPEEVIAVLPVDNALNQIIRQKAATPVREAMPSHDLAQEFRHMMKPNAVVAEKTSVGLTDVNASHVSALQATATKSSGDREQTAGPIPAKILWHSISVCL